MRRPRGRWPLPVILFALTLSGCGDDGQNEGARDTPAVRELKLNAERSPAQRPRILVAALGDSITAGSPLWDPDLEIRAGIGSSLDRRSQYEYWVEQRSPGVKFRNCGVFGERTDQIAARLDGCAQGAKVLVVQGGINDIAQMRDVKAAAGDLLRMVRRGKQRGLRVAVTEVLPWNNGPPGAASRILRLNRLIAKLARAEDVPVFRWYERLEDPQSPGRMGRTLTIDGDHPSVEGYRRLAGAVELP